MRARKFWRWLCSPLRKAKKNTYLKRLRFTFAQMEQHPEEGPFGNERKYTLEIIVWLIRYYSGNEDAKTEGTPEIKLSKLLRTSKESFSERDLVQAKILSYWSQYKHIEGY